MGPLLVSPAQLRGHCGQPLTALHNLRCGVKLLYHRSLSLVNIHREVIVLVLNVHDKFTSLSMEPPLQLSYVANVFATVVLHDLLFV